MAFFEIRPAKSPLTTRVLLGVLLTFCLTQAKAQFDTSYIRNIDKYIAETDSLAQAQKLITGTSDGSITTATMKVVYDSVQSKNDTSWTPNEIGKFWLEYVYRNDTAFKIVYRDNTDKNIVETFYYRNKQPVCTKLRLENADSVLYQGVEYYKNNKTIYTVSPPAQASKEYRNRVLFSWRDAGIKYYLQITTGSR